MDDELTRLKRTRDFLLAARQRTLHVPTRDKLELQEIELRIAKLEGREPEEPR